MKRIYLLMILFVAFMGNAMAQATDLELLTTIRTTDTMYWSTKGHYYRLLAYGFVNHGPVALTQSDTLVLRKGYSKGGINTYNYSLPAAGMKIGDTLYPTSGLDTVRFTAGPTTNPYKWCDSLWRKGTGGVIADANITAKPNFKCGNVRFIQMNNVSVNDVDVNAKGFAVYPNPAFNSIAFNYKYDGTDVNLTVRDMTGKIVHAATLKDLNGEQEMNVDVSYFPAGMYILEVVGNNEKLTSKFTVTK